MKKPADFSDTINRGATEARDAVQQAATVIENEWKRIVSSVEDTDKVPSQVKVVVDRLDGTVDHVKDFVSTNGPKAFNEGVRVARQYGVPVPEDWGSATDAAEDVADDIVDAELVDTVEDTVADADEKATKATATAKKTAKKTAKTAKKATKATAKKAADAATDED
ncbi:MAG: hypothetical protein AAGD35_16660 [Actinomycetota bacterium]